MHTPTSENQPLIEQEKAEVLMMVVYGNKLRIDQEACALFNQPYPDRSSIARNK